MLITRFGLRQIMGGSVVIYCSHSKISVVNKKLLINYVLTRKYTPSCRFSTMNGSL